MNHIAAKIFLLGTLLGCLLPLSAQENPGRSNEDSTAQSELSPSYMPVSYTFLDPCQFAPLSYIEEDTSLLNTHYFDELSPIGRLYQSLGISGQARQPINFDFHRDRGFTYLNYPYALLMPRQQDIRYYKVKTSYTRLAFMFIPVGGEMMRVKAAHAQNAGGVNFGFNLEALSNKGYFVNQMTKNFVGSAYIHYELPSQRWGIRASYIFTRVNNEENGGLVGDSTAILNCDTFLYGKGKRPATNVYACNTPDATGRTVSNDLLLQQYLNLKFKKEGVSLGYLTHSFQSKTYKTRYFNPRMDTIPLGLGFLGDTTADSLSYYHIINTLQWSTFHPYAERDEKKNLLHLAFGITHEYMEDRLVRIPFPGIESDAGGRIKKSGRYTSNSTMLFGRAYLRLFSVMEITGGISYTFSGYNRNDAIAEATARWMINREKSHFIGLTAHFYRINPDYIFTYFSGNERRWDTSWHKQNILRLGAYWHRKKIKVDFNYFLLNNYAYFQEDLLPTQWDGSGNLLQLRVSTPVRIKNFGLNTNIYLQYSGHEVVKVPVFAGKMSTYYIFNVFKKRMKLLFQIDLMYNTPYDAPGYSPMLRQFYHQDRFACGNYLYMDANLTVQVSRLSFFFRGCNLLAGLIGRNYFTTPYYPMEGQQLQIGVNWRFYD